MAANTLNDILVEIGKKFEILRKNYKLSQESVSYDTGLDIKTYRNIEKGRSKLRIGTMKLLIEYFNRKLNQNIKLSYFKN